MFYFIAKKSVSLLSVLLPVRSGLGPAGEGTFLGLTVVLPSGGGLDPRRCLLRHRVLFLLRHLRF